MNLKYLNKICDSSFDFTKIVIDFEGDSWFRLVLADKETVRQEVQDRDPNLLNLLQIDMDCWYLHETAEHNELLPFRNKEAQIFQARQTIKSIINANLYSASATITVDDAQYDLLDDYQQLQNIGLLDEDLVLQIKELIDGKDFSSLDFDEDDLI